MVDKNKDGVETIAEDLEETNTIDEEDLVEDEGYDPAAELYGEGTLDGIPDIEYNIAEAYTSIQGEGVFVGMPTFFLRFAGCSLDCSWCDAKDLKVNPNFIPEVLAQMIVDNADLDFVITGGEPMESPLPLAALLDMAFAVKEQSDVETTITIDTNGNISPQQIGLPLELANRILWSVSPKLHSSFEDWRKVQFRDYAELSNVQYKFVIDPYDEEDLKDFRGIMCFLPKTAIVVVQPVASIDEDDLVGYVDAYKELFKFITEEGYTRVRVLPQLQKLIWGMSTKSV